MQTKREQMSYEMTLLPPLESLIPEDHRLLKLHRVLDLGFIHEMVRDRYCSDNGRPSVDPEVVMRLFILQAIEGIRSIRELMREVQVNLAYRWFIGYRMDESLPDHSTLSKALDRFGDEVFNQLFEQSIAQCRQSGLIEGKILHVDATTIRADVDKNKVNKPESTDHDARFGRFGDGSKQPGYKQHTVVDDQSGVVVGLSVTPANAGESGEALAVVDEAIRQLGESPEVICADSAYANGVNKAGCEARGVRLVSPPTKPCNQLSGEYFGIEEFHYDEVRDEFVCPAGQKLRSAGRQARPERHKYQGLPRVCGQCVLKPQCTGAPQRSVNASIYHGSLVRLRADSKTKSFRALYRRRAPVIEGVFAEAKQWHGLRRAWRRGLSKMKIQCLLIATVLNLKRLITVFPTELAPLTALVKTIFGFIRHVWEYLTFNSSLHVSTTNC